MRILVGVCARQKPDIFRLFLTSLFGLDTEGLTVDYHFIFHNWEEGKDLLSSFAQPQGSVLAESYRSDNDYIVDEMTHRWNNALVADMSAMKNRIIDHALRKGYDGVFFVDSDLLLYSETLRWLVDSGKDVVAEVFWTRWTPNEPAKPNAWDYDHYGILDGSLDLWRVPGTYRVAGTGACILLRRAALTQGLSYALVPGVSWWGEDRAMQLRAAVLGIPIHLDTHYPAHHLYRQEEVAHIGAWSALRPKVRKTEGNRIAAMMVLGGDAVRHLEGALEGLGPLCDEVAVLCEAAVAERVQQIASVFPRVRVRPVPPAAQGAGEKSLRHLVWEFAAETEPDWLLAVDPDERFEDGGRERLRAMLDQTSFDIIALNNNLVANPRRRANGPSTVQRFVPYVLRYFPQFPYAFAEPGKETSPFPVNVGRFPACGVDLSVTCVS